MMNMWKRNYHPFNRRDLKRMVHIESLFIVCCILIAYHIVVGIISIIVLLIVKYAILKDTTSQDTQTSQTKSDKGRKWLVLADEEVCCKAFDGDGYIYINSLNHELGSSDVVYVYAERLEQVLFKAKVLKEHDKSQVSICKLKLIDKYRGHALSDSILRHKGFKGVNSIKLPICEPVELLDYIEEKFVNQIYTE